MGMDDQLGHLLHQWRSGDLFRRRSRASTSALSASSASNRRCRSGQRCNYGGELYVLIPTGLTPMSTVLKSGREGVEAADKNVVSCFLRNAVAYPRELWLGGLHQPQHRAA